MNKHINSDNARPFVRALGIAAAAVVALAILGCNATKGLGEDLQESSDNVKKVGQ
jgi:predicted small secreted protein